MDLNARIEATAEKMATQLRVRGESIEEVAERAGRRIPRRLRSDVGFLVEAETLSRHPKLARQVDKRRLDRAERRLHAFLDRLNPRAERLGQLLDIVAGVAFVLVSVALAVFFFLLWRGYFD